LFLINFVATLLFANHILTNQQSLHVVKSGVPSKTTNYFFADKKTIDQEKVAGRLLS